MRKKKSKTVNKRITNRHVSKTTRSKTTAFKKEIIQYLDSNGYLSWSTKDNKYIILGSSSPKNGLVQCPDCKIGELMIIRSPSTRKRFMGCSNFYGGCNASSPLLQKAKLRAIKDTCKLCKWPIVIYRYSRKQSWTRQCSNIKCASNVKPAN